jgi:hypothetical protein
VHEDPDQVQFRVWPDGTVQCCDDDAYTYMSDDYQLVWACDEDEAYEVTEQRGNNA